MKIREGKAKFKPIIIEIETEEEVESLFSVVNNGSGMPLKQYCEQRDIDQGKVYKLTHKIYSFLSDLGITDY